MHLRDTLDSLLRAKRPHLQIQIQIHLQMQIHFAGTAADADTHSVSISVRRMGNCCNLHGSTLDELSPTLLLHPQNVQVSASVSMYLC